MAGRCTAPSSTRNAKSTGSEGASAMPANATASIARATAARERTASGWRRNHRMVSGTVTIPAIMLTVMNACAAPSLPPCATTTRSWSPGTRSVTGTRHRKVARVRRARGVIS